LKQAVKAHTVVAERPDVPETSGKEKENPKGTEKVTSPFSAASTDVQRVVEIPR